MNFHQTSFVKIVYLLTAASAQRRSGEWLQCTSAVEKARFPGCTLAGRCGCCSGPPCRPTSASSGSAWGSSGGLIRLTCSIHSGWMIPVGLLKFTSIARHMTTPQLPSSVSIIPWSLWEECSDTLDKDSSNKYFTEITFTIMTLLHRFYSVGSMCIGLYLPQLSFCHSSTHYDVDCFRCFAYRHSDTRPITITGNIENYPARTIVRVIFYY